MTDNLPQTQRIEYIDCIKGFTILWVVAFHVPDMLPDWGRVLYRMPLFFFMSGFFFRQRPFKPFLVRRINTILLPLAFFYVIAVLFCVIKYEIFGSLFPSIDYVYIGGFKEYTFAFTRLIDIFPRSEIVELMSPFTVNSALWFLVALFNIQLIYYGLRKCIYSGWLLVAICCLCYVISAYMIQYNMTGPFYLPRTMQYLFYYALGQMFGRKLIDLMDNTKTKYLYIVFVVFCGVLYGLGFLQSENLVFYHILLNVKIAVFIPLVFIFFRMVYKFPLLRIFSFFGRNSLVVFVLHAMVISIFEAMARMVPLEIFTNVPVRSVAEFIFILLTCYAGILIFNRYFPWMVGKKELITLPDWQTERTL